MKKILIAVMIIALYGCDSDPFGFRDTTIISPYELEKAETGTHYYLVSPGDNKAYGVLEGTVGKIGWNERYILVWQNGDGLASGWRVVDTKDNSLTPILSEYELNKLPHVKNISVKEPSQVLKE